MSKEYILAITLTLGAVLKAFGIEIENNVIEGIVFGVVTLVMAILRYKKGGIDLLGRKV